MKKMVKSKVIGLRVSPETLESVRDAAAYFGMSVNAYILMCAVTKSEEIRKRMEEEE